MFPGQQKSCNEKTSNLRQSDLGFIQDLISMTMLTLFREPNKVSSGSALIHNCTFQHHHYLSLKYFHKQTYAASSTHLTSLSPLSIFGNTSIDGPWQELVFRLFPRKPRLLRASHSSAWPSAATPTSAAPPTSSAAISAPPPGAAPRGRRSRASVGWLLCWSVFSFGLLAVVFFVLFVGL